MTTSTHGKYSLSLLFLFLISLPLVNPWVRGDGVGYYAYARALLIQHNLHFEADWRAANTSFSEGRVDANGQLVPDQFSATGYVKNHFSIGPAILWAPFLVGTHAFVLTADRLGAAIPANGFSRPYVITMALATAFYGFCGLLLAFDLARRYFSETCAFLATLGIWLASSLPVYMYFNPSWSHAQSAFSVALFLWYWQRTRGQRTIRQWLVLALLAGLMMNIYYPNAIVLLVPGVEALSEYRAAFLAGKSEPKEPGRLFLRHAAFVFVATAALLPTFLTRWILYGNALETGYPSLRTWSWLSPSLLAVLFSSDHGLLTWTPILIPAVAGLVIFSRRDAILGGGLLLSFLAFYYFIASYPSWDGISSFGNRFFVSLTPLFVIGLAASLDSFVGLWRRSAQGMAVASATIALLVLWNGGAIFQWGTAMIPARGPISWRQMVHNQYAVVPAQIVKSMELYAFRRDAMMQGIEQRDVQRLKEDPRP